MIEHTISFCTVCMNRLQHLKQTLHKNIQDNINYQKVEFVLLDYNSSDGLDLYVNNTFGEELRDGRLVCYKTFTPLYFNRSHSKNLAFRLANGDIICNVDADNFTGKEFACYINEVFNKRQNLFLSTCKAASTDVVGRICMRKKDFLLVKGFDERMTCYGFEDLDLINRLEALGLRRGLISNSEYLEAVRHKGFDRISNEYLAMNLKYLFIRYITPSVSVFLFLLSNGAYIKGTLLDNNFRNFHPKSLYQEINKHNDEYSLLESNWEEGTWIQKNEEVRITSDFNSEILYFKKTRNLNTLIQKEGRLHRMFSEVTDYRLKEHAIFFYSLLRNKLIMRKNRLNSMFSVNSSGYGKAVVYKNNNFHNPIIVL